MNRRRKYKKQMKQGLVSSELTSSIPMKVYFEESLKDALDYAIEKLTAPDGLCVFPDSPERLFAKQYITAKIEGIGE